MFKTLEEVLVIASAVFVGMTTATIVRSSTWSMQHPYTWLTGSIFGVLALVGFYDAFQHIKFKRKQVHFFKDMKVGGCCQDEGGPEVVGRNKNKKGE